MIIPIKLPKLSPTMEKGIIAKWLKKVGDQVKQGDILCTITTDKSTVEYESMEDGYLRKILVKEGEKALLNQDIALMTEKSQDDISSYQEEKAFVEETVTASAETKQQAQKETPAVGIGIQGFAPVPPKEGVHFAFNEERDFLLASPLAKKIAKEKGLDLNSVKGSGPHGRILAKDLELAQGASIVSIGPRSSPSLPPGTFEEEELTPMRRVIGERLHASKLSIPHYYVTDEILADKMMDLRAQLKEIGIKVTFNDFILRAVALALKKHPEVNSGYNSIDHKIIRFKTIDISLAVAIPDGLITPILFHADYKNIFELSEEAKRLAKKAKENSLLPEEYQGGSFTISNLGMYNISSFDAVINPPQAAILAIGGILEKPVAIKGKIELGHVMKITLSADHRVIDGADAAQFLASVKLLLENPANLII